MLGTILVIIPIVLVIVILGTWLVGERGRLMLPSTWRWLRESGWRSVFNGDF